MLYSLFVLFAWGFMSVGAYGSWTTCYKDGYDFDNDSGTSYDLDHTSTYTYEVNSGTYTPIGSGTSQLSYCFSYDYDFDNGFGEIYDFLGSQTALLAVSNGVISTITVEASTTVSTQSDSSASASTQQSPTTPASATSTLGSVASSASPSATSTSTTSSDDASSTSFASTSSLPSPYTAVTLGFTFLVPTTLMPGIQTVAYPETFGSSTSSYGIAYSVGSRTTEILRPVTFTAAAPTTPPHPSHSHTGAIAGGVVGGLAGLAIIAGATVFFLRRRKKNETKTPIQEISQIS